MSQYEAQLARLDDAFERSLVEDPAPLRQLIARMASRLPIYVGSGGALAVARLAADLHEWRSRTLARAATPLELTGLPPLINSGVVMFTASGKHPDALLALRSAIERHADPVGVVTHRSHDQLPDAYQRDGVSVVSLGPLPHREGFLATTSVLSMAVSLVQASDFELPGTLPNLHIQTTSSLRDRCLILFGPGSRSVAIDLETRLAETGISQAQVTDYRNFAHGRHHGFARHLDETTVVALVADPFRKVAEATLNRLPDEAAIIQIESPLGWPGSALDMLVGSMRLVGSASRAAQFDPARPRVPRFGRGLYRMPSKRLIQRVVRDPVDRKIAAARARSSDQLRAFYSKALDDWLEQIHDATFGAITMDYDGTVCTTEGRFDLPSERLQKAVLSLLDDGLTLGFASGRGRSLHRDLRRWIPRSYWSQVDLGLYNGGLHLSLNEDLVGRNEPSGALADADARIKGSSFAPMLDIEAREHQLVIEPSAGMSLTPEMVTSIVSELLGRAPRLPLKVVSSAHSVDVIPELSGKTLTFKRLQERFPNEVLAIGDQGQLGGNDFELLASTPFSLSVDRCSADPSRCWNLDATGKRGPELLTRYLNALTRSRRGFRLRWRHK